MGLDSVDILVQVEKQFGISIGDTEAEQIVTIQDFVNVVYSKIKLSPGDTCKSRLLFHKLRGYFIDKLGYDRQQIRPTTIIGNVIVGDLRSKWRGLETFLGLQLPSLADHDVFPDKNMDLKFLGLSGHETN